MFSLPASIKRIGPKATQKSGDTNFLNVSLRGLFRRSMADNSAAGGPIWPKFESIQDIMHVLITCKFEEGRINSNREKVVTSIFRQITLKGR